MEIVFLIVTKNSCTRDKSIYDGATGEDGKTAFYGTCLYAVSFVDNDWAQVDYSTLTRITRTKYNFTLRFFVQQHKGQTDL